MALLGLIHAMEKQTAVQEVHLLPHLGGISEFTWLWLLLVAEGGCKVQASEPQVERRAESPLFTFSLNLAHLIESKMPSLLRSTTTLYAA